jgi:hypothetical protein
VTWVLLVPTRPVGDFAMYLESAAHVVEHGALEHPEFVYMPGYVFLLALVAGAGGGVLAAKLVGAALGGLCNRAHPRHHPAPVGRTGRPWRRPLLYAFLAGRPSLSPA